MSNGYIGRVIGGRYEIRELIGRGTAADVYRAFHVQCNCYVAFKIVHKNLTTGKSFAEHFNTLGEALVKLDHPNIRAVQDFGYSEADDMYYVVMDYVEATPLRSVLEELAPDEHLPLGEALRIARDVARALDYAHRQNVIHGSVRPTEIMLRGDGRVLVTGFGLRDLVSPTAKLVGVTIGDPAYHAPEQHWRQPSPPSVDIYSLGILLHRLITGQAAQAGERPILPSDLPDGVAQVLRRATAQDPAQRYSSAETLADYLTNLAEASRTGMLKRQPASAAPAESTNDIPLPAHTRETPPAPVALPPRQEDTPPPPPVTPPPPKSAPAAPNSPRRVALGLVSGLTLFAAGIIGVLLMHGIDGTRLAPENATQTATAATLAALATDVSGTGTALALTPTATNTTTPTATDTTTYTPTASPTASQTPLPSDTLVPSSTPTASATLAASATATPSGTATPEPSPTATAPDTPTSTQTATATPTPTQTFTPTLTPTASATATATATPTMTPLPYLPVPYVVDFEGVDPLGGWELDPKAWQLVTDEAGNRVLHGIAEADQTAVVLGESGLPPIWAYESLHGLVISTRFNLPDGGGMRLVFRNGKQGFYAVRALPGSLALQRAPLPHDLQSIESGRVAGMWPDAPVEAGRWHRLTIWLDGTHIYIYLDDQLGIMHNDADLLSPGDIMFQAHNAGPDAPLQVDDLRITTPYEASQHFNTTWPLTWSRSSQDAAALRQNDNNRYVHLTGPGDLSPAGSFDDFAVACRFWSRAGGFRLYTREDSGAYLLDFDAGTLGVLQIASGGAILSSAVYPDAYSAGRWHTLAVRASGERLTVSIDGVHYHDEHSDGPRAGALRFALAGGDELMLDDCLLYALGPSATDPTRFAADILAALAARDEALGPPPSGQYNFFEGFNSERQTMHMWEGENPGQYIEDESVEGITRRYYYRLVHQGQPTWRRWKDDIAPFVAGDDFPCDENVACHTTNFVAGVDVNFPPGQSGTAWLAGRAQLTPTGLDLYHYRLAVTQESDGERTITVSLRGHEGPVTLWQGPEPGPGAGWIRLMMVASGDQIAFYVNGRPVYVETSVPVDTMGTGSIAIGVDEHTVAWFDELTIRSLHDLAPYFP